MIHLTRKALAWLQLGYHEHVEIAKAACGAEERVFPWCQVEDVRAMVSKSPTKSLRLRRW